MERKEEFTQVLNDLLKINNDRIRQYKKATKEIADLDWRTLFLSNIDESKKFGMELSLEIMRNGGEPKVGSTTTSGKIYRFWMEIKDTLTGKDRESILNECEFVEDAVLRAYERAMQRKDFSVDISRLLGRQLELLRESHATINRYRDMTLLDLYKI
ncbi:MAG: PA2169 family four-helix-bundle protein [Cyclobacteriaceae bacterium]|nr:PA2169 family four-helix-bundle protein [Cyclobacteriaceae bacterium]